MLPGQLTNRWAVEVGKWFVVDDTEMGCDGRRCFFGDGQTGTEIEAEVLGREHGLADGDVCLILRARSYRTGLPRQFLVRHLPCIGTTSWRLKSKLADIESPAKPGRPKPR